MSRFFEFNTEECRLLETACKARINELRMNWEIKMYGDKEVIKEQQKEIKLCENLISVFTQK
jgi:hypothetical protein